MTMTTYCQPARLRRRYHGISSGRLPTQMSRNCENDMYAQKMTKANSRLPKPRRCLGRRAPAKGGRSAKSSSTVRAKAKPLSSWPTANITG